MKLLYDFFPIALFFIAYKTADIYTATIVVILASIAQVGFAYYKHKRVEPMHLVTLALVISLGGLTILLHDKAFIMWKPTLVNWGFALAFILTSVFTAKPLIQRLLSSQLNLPAPVWTRLNILWICFFVLSGAVNVYFVKNYQNAELELITAAPNMDSSRIDELHCENDFEGNLRELCNATKDKESLWVNFKLFGMLGLTFIFIIVQGFYLYRFIEPEDAESKDKKLDT